MPDTQGVVLGYVQVALSGRTFSSGLMYIFQATFLEEIKAVADAFHEALEPEVQKELPPEMVRRVVGHDFGMQDYIN